MKKLRQQRRWTQSGMNVQESQWTWHECQWSNWMQGEKEDECKWGKMNEHEWKSIQINETSCEYTSHKSLSHNTIDSYWLFFKLQTHLLRFSCFLFGKNSMLSWNRAPHVNIRCVRCELQTFSPDNSPKGIDQERAAAGVTSRLIAVHMMYVHWQCSHQFPNAQSS